MKIEKVYRDQQGTVWMYASCRVPKHVKPKRRRNHRRKRSMPLWYKSLVLASLLIILSAFTMGTSKPNNNQLDSEPAVTTTLKDFIPEEEVKEVLSASLITMAPSPEVVTTEEPVQEEIVPEEDPDVTECFGQETFTIGSSSFTSLPLPDEYYPGLDFSSFQPYEDYGCITNTRSAAYSITRSDRAYNDENGLRRYTVTDDQFSVNDEDDYVIALGTFYKPKGTCGQRYLIVTSTGYYTAIAGDEKADQHTDDLHMFSLHADGTCAGIIEWLVDTSTLNTSMKRSGNIATSRGPVECLKGEIEYIYLIEE